MQNDVQRLVTFCTTCHNRAWQLKQVLPENLRLFRNRATKMRDHRAEFLILNYGSTDDLESWIYSNFMDDITAGLLTYYRDASPQFFHASRAKNLAHLLGQGAYLCNLDCDNWVAGLFERVLSVCGSGRVLHAFDRYGDGTYGRIAMSRYLFRDLRGYDENLLPMGFQDADLLNRVRSHGVPIEVCSGWPVPVANTIEEKIACTGLEKLLTNEEMNRANQALVKMREGLGLTVNPSGFGAGRVSKNFGAYEYFTGSFIP